MKTNGRLPRPLLRMKCLLVLGLLAARPCSAETLPSNDPTWAATQQAIERGIAFLQANQKDTGAISSGQYDTAMTALSTMAMASVGVTPSEPGPRGDCMRRAIDFVVDERRRTSEGYFGQHDGSRMYGHGITTLMLSEMAGMGASAEQDEAIERACEGGLSVILEAQQVRKPQSHRGGWRYTPDAGDSDLSVSVWQLMALRSAKTDGFDVPDAAIAEAVTYLRRSCTSPLDEKGQPTRPESGFAYTPGGGDIQYAMTAAGVLAMQVCGQYDAPPVMQAVAWLKSHPPAWGTRYFFYGTYYYAQAMHQQGGDTAADAERLVREVLLPRQEADGGWKPEGEESGASRIYATSLAILSLSVRYHYLPIYQR
jgi:hypothetical protein